MPPPPQPPPATLIEELIEEILLRFPPDKPAGLFRASLVCKPWCRLISGPRFRRRYREFHRTPPMLGFLCDSMDPVETVRFVPTSAFRSPLADRRHCRLLDARHGRVLLLRVDAESAMERDLVVWDPITDEQREIPMLKMNLPMRSWKAAVVCGARACDHLDCNRGPFHVVLVVSCPREMHIWTYTSDTGSWSDPIISQEENFVVLSVPSMFVGNALYFGVHSEQRILKYDLESHEISPVALPPKSFFGQPFSMSIHPFVLTTTEDGRLGIATIHESKLYMWSMKHGPEADDGWTCHSLIELETLLCSNAILTKPHLVGFLDWIGVGFLRTDDFLFMVDLNTHKVKKIYEGREIYKVFPYMSFCTPALGGGRRGGGPSTGVSSA